MGTVWVPPGARDVGSDGTDTASDLFAGADVAGVLRSGERAVDGRTGPRDRVSKAWRARPRQRRGFVRRDIRDGRVAGAGALQTGGVVGDRERVAGVCIRLH